MTPVRLGIRVRREQAELALAGRADEVVDAFDRHGLVEACRRVRGEWAAVLFTRRTSPSRLRRPAQASAGTGERA